MCHRQAEAELFIPLLEPKPPLCLSIEVMNPAFASTPLAESHQVANARDHLCKSTVNLPLRVRDMQLRQAEGLDEQ